MSRRSKRWRDWAASHKLTTANHPQCNGINERFNGTLCRTLRNYFDANLNDWDLALKWSVYAYNTTNHESTGYSPYQVLFGFDPRSPLSPDSRDQIMQGPKSREKMRSAVAQQIAQSQKIQKTYYDLHRRAPNLFIGQIVVIRVHSLPRHEQRKFSKK